MRIVKAASIFGLLGLAVQDGRLPLGQAEASADTSAIVYSQMNACPVTDHLIYSAAVNATDTAVCQQLSDLRSQLYILPEDDTDTRPGLQVQVDALRLQLSTPDAVDFYEEAVREGKLECTRRGAIYTQAYIPNDRNSLSYFTEKQLCQPGQIAGQYFHLNYYRCASCPLSPMTVHAPPAASLSNALDPSSGAMNLTGHGGAYVTYAIQASDDLQTWTKLTALTADGSGSFSYVDSDAPNHNQRFYRALAYQQ